MMKNKYKVSDLISLLIYIGVFQALLSILMFLSNDFKNFITYYIIDIGHLTSHVMNEQLKFIMSGRLNGIASELTFGMPLYQGFTLLLIYYKFLEGKFSYSYLTPFIVSSILLNARIGLIIIPIVILVSLYFINNKKLFWMASKFAIVLVFFLVVVISVLFTLGDPYLIFLILTAGITENSYIPHADIIFGKHIYLPDNFIQLVFGEGRYLFANKYELIHSDIGFVNTIMFGGILFFTLLIFPYLYLFLKRFKYFAKTFQMLTLSVIFFLLITGFKGESYMLNSLTKSILLLYTYLLCSFSNDYLFNSDIYKKLRFSITAN